DRLAGQREDPRKPPQRDRRRVLRFARLYRIHRESRARGGVEFPARISRRARSTGQPVRRDARPILRRWDHGVLQRPRADPDPAERAVNMAVAMREAASSLTSAWRERGRELGFGAGIAQGYATLGQIGFSERSGYTAIGTVCNVAARLCGEAKDGQ